MSELKIKIIGGGYSGLIQAFYLIEKGLNVEVFEREDKTGGLLGSQTCDGFLSENAANAFVANKELERICKIIQVDLVSLKKESKKRFIYRSRRMSRLPIRWVQLLKLFLFLLKYKFSLIQKSQDKTQSVKDWVLQNLGPDFNDFLIEPGLQGIFAASSDQLNAQLVAGSIFTKYKKGQMKGSIAPQKGMQDFINKMTLYLESKGCQFILNNNYEPQTNVSLEPNSDRNKGESGSERSLKQAKEIVVWAVGLKHLKELMVHKKIDLPVSLANTKTTSLTSVKLLFHEEQPWTQGFGCLFPKKESFNSLGVLFNHNIFPNRALQGSSETWILNDDQIEFSTMSKMALERYVFSDRYKVSGAHQLPDQILIHQWKNRIPLYDNNLREFISELESFQTPYYFVGNYLGQIGLSKLIFRAKTNAEQIFKELNV